METAVLFGLIALCFIAQALLSIHCQRAIKELSEDFNDRGERYRLWLNEFEKKVNKRIDDFMLHSYKPKFKFGDMVEWDFKTIFGTSIPFKGKVVGVECVAVEYFVWEKLTVDTGNSVQKVDAKDCTLQQPEPVKRGRPKK